MGHIVMDRLHGQRFFKMTYIFFPYTLVSYLPKVVQGISAGGIVMVLLGWGGLNIASLIIVSVRDDILE